MQILILIPICFQLPFSVLVSAVQKLSRSNLIPPGTQLYRGMGGLMDLPDCFLQSDETDAVDTLSGALCQQQLTEASRFNTAASSQACPKATVMVIHPSSVDRGACIVEFSQYPGEKVRVS